MGERSYLVYEPTPKGAGIPIALFSSMELATMFIASYFEKYYYEPNLAIKQVQVNDKNNLHSYMNMPAEDISEENISPMGDPFEEPFICEIGD